MSRHGLKRLHSRASPGTKNDLPGELLWAPLLPAEQRHASKPPSLFDCSGTICRPQIPKPHSLKPCRTCKGLELDWKLKSSSDRSARLLTSPQRFIIWSCKKAKCTLQSVVLLSTFGSPEKAHTARSPATKSPRSGGLQLAAYCRGIWLGCTLAAHSLHRRTGPEAIPGSSLSRAHLIPAVNQCAQACGSFPGAAWELPSPGA